MFCEEIERVSVAFETGLWQSVIRGAMGARSFASSSPFKETVKTPKLTSSNMGQHGTGLPVVPGVGRLYIVADECSKSGHADNTQLGSSSINNYPTWDSLIFDVTELTTSGLARSISQRPCPGLRLGSQKYNNKLYCTRFISQCLSSDKLHVYLALASLIST